MLAVICCLIYCCLSVSRKWINQSLNLTIGYMAISVKIEFSQNYKLLIAQDPLQGDICI